MSSVLKFLIGFLTFVLLWTLLILLLTAQLSYDGSPWAANLTTAFRQSTPWIFISPLIIVFSLWFPLIHDRWWMNTALHLSLCIIILLGIGRMRSIILAQWPAADKKQTTITQRPASSEATKENKRPSIQNIPEPLPAPILAPAHLEAEGNISKESKHSITKSEIDLSRTAPLGVPLYISILLLCSLFRYRQEVLTRDQKAQRLEAQLTQTQLDLLRSQLQPHFLFNTLNSISSLVHTAPDKADSMIIQLSNLLRCTLEQRDATFITLQQEIDTLLTYLDIQSTRFGDRIIVKTTIDPKTSDFSVPPMILLPLVENAVRYGVEKTMKPTTITIFSKLTADKLLLTITDDGPGITQSNETGTGVGLPNTTSRLLTLYPEGSTKVALAEDHNGHTVASIELPTSP